MASNTFILSAVLSMTILFLQANSQTNPACTPTMITSVSPCMNFLTNSSANATTPNAECCDSLRSLTNSGMGCLCLLVTGNFPFRIPINRTTAVSLPRACNMPSVPVQCQASVAPAAAPGPFASGIPFSPPSSPTPQASSVVPGLTPPAQSPESDATPTSPAVDAGAPAADGGSGRPSTNPSAAFRPYTLSPSLLFIAIGLVVY